MNILAECNRRGIRIEANDDMLKVDSPKGALSRDPRRWPGYRARRTLAVMRGRSAGTVPVLGRAGAGRACGRLDPTLPPADLRLPR